MGHNATGGKGGGERKVLVYLVLIFQVALIISLIRGIQLSKRSSQRVEMLRETKQKLEEENAKLHEEARYVESDYYLEKVAREELQRAKAGETVVILPEITPEEDSKKFVSRERGEEVPIWRKWWQLLVK